MKTSEAFKNIISAHLELAGVKDPLFAETLKKENKNIDDCITYILNTVKASGQNGFADSDIFQMARHYYDEDDIKVGAKINTTIVVNHVVEITEEEKIEAKEKAIRELIAEEKAKMKKDPLIKKPSSITPPPTVQDSLF